jgi:DNA-directed RNA polymerase beta subunit/DNA-directed RNA polymerase beta' subunit
MMNVLRPTEQNKEITNTLHNVIKNVFPIVGKYHRLELIGDIKVGDPLPDNDFPAQREIKLNKKSWHVPVTASLRLVDLATNKVIDDAKNVKIANIPTLTNRFSMIIDGNEYTTTNQFRLKPGVYTREKANGELESQFNLELGFNFNMRMDPEEGIFYLVAGNQNYHLYTLLYAFGIGDVELQNAWGKELLDKNKTAGINKIDQEIPALYKKVRHIDLPTPKAIVSLKEYFNNTKISPETTKITIGHSFEKVTPELLILTSKKLLAIMRKEVDQDERDSLVFKELNSVSDLLNKYFITKTPTITKNLTFRTDNKNIVKEIISSDTFSKPIKEFFTVGDLSNPSPQTNPIEMLNEWRKTTVMGTGAIQSSHAINYNMRDVHPTHLGFLDPINTPEGHKVGVTLPLTIDVAKRGNDITTLIITSSGDKTYLTPYQFFNKKIGFPDQHKNGKALYPKIKAMWKGKSILIESNEVDGYLAYPSSMFAYTTNLIPFMMNDSGPRALYAAKMITQSVPLKNPEVPYVKVGTPNVKETFEDLTGTYLNPKVPPGFGNAEVTKIEPDYIHLKNKKGETTKVGLYKEFPLNQESFLNSEVIVHVGDKLKELDILAKTNFNSFDDTGKIGYAPGLNVNVAYMPWHGYNFEDGVVITESLAKRLTSESMMHDSIIIQPTGILDLKKFRAYFPTLIKPENMSKLSDSGVIKEGITINPDEIMVAYMEETDLTDTERILKSMSKSLAKPFRPKPLVWDHDVPGIVTHVRHIGNTIYIYTKTENPMVIGDKLTGRHGNKGIVTKIIKDDEAPHTPDGTRIDLILNPHGVVGRMNAGQILETAAGRLAMKQKKPFVVNNFSGENYLDGIIGEMKKNKLEPDEILLDGKKGKPFKNKIFWGNQHILKLMHVVEHKLKTRDLPGTYDVNEQPVAGTGGGQSADPMQLYAFLAHGAKENLRELALIKGQKNDEYWRMLQLGLPPAQPKKNFVFDKLIVYLKGAGINVTKNGDLLQILPLNNKEVLKMSNGEITDPGHLLVGKNLATIPGGLFDTKITGGLKGDKWSHITLDHEIPNPIFEPAITTVLDITSTQFNKIIQEEVTENNLTGVDLIKQKLKNLNIDKRIKELNNKLLTVKGSQVNTIHKQLRYLNALNKFGMSADEAYMIKYLPIIPPKYRPVFPLESGDLRVAPINKHYHDIGLIHKKMKEIENLGLDSSFNKDNRINLYKSVKAAFGLADPITATREKYEGLLQTLSGSSPKFGFIQDKVWAKRQDLSARSTITIEPSLSINEVGLPDVISKSLYKPFIIRELVQQGLNPTTAIEHYKTWTPVADKALSIVMENRPVILNRAPTLHKHGVQAFKPIRFTGSSIRLNPLIMKGFNADIDGDTMSVQIPISTLAVEEANNMMPSEIPFKAGDSSLIPGISQDYMLGLYYLTQPGKETNKKFSSLAEVKKAKLDTQDVFSLNGKKTTLGKLMVNAVLPKKITDPNIIIDSNSLDKLLKNVIKNHPKEFGNVISSLKDLGNQYAHERGTSLSITDLAIDRSYRDNILKKYDAKLKPGMSVDEITNMYVKAKDEIIDQQHKVVKNNRMYEMYNSGSLGKKGTNAMSQLLSLPGIMQDVQGRPIPYPVKKSWSEGLDSFDYWNTSYGARKGAVDKSVNTQKSGALNKELLMNVKNLIIVEEDCGTLDGIEIPANDKHVLDRYLADTIFGVGKRNDLINYELVNKAAGKKVTTLKVRSPLTCESDDGVCVKCYGLMSNGFPPRIGENVGVIDAQAVTERSTQLTLQTFHCFHPHTSVVTSDYKLVTLKKLIDSQYAGKILDKNNTFVNVKECWKHSINDIIKFLKTKDGHSLILQNNHPLPVGQNTYICAYCGGRLAGKKITKCKLCNKRSHSVTNINKNTAEIYELAKLVKNNHTLFLTNLPKKLITYDLPLDPYMLGAWIAEGSVHHKKNLGLIWTQQPQTPIHTEYKKKLNSKVFGKNIYLYDHDIASKIILECGDRSYNKTLPSNILNYSEEIQYQILAGIIDGDGTIMSFPKNGKHRGNDLIIIDTTSYGLANQLILLTKQLKIESNMHQATVKKISRYQPFRISLKLNAAQLKKLKKTSVRIKMLSLGTITVFKDPGTIKTIKNTFYPFDAVYDIKTDSGTFIANGIYVHNSGGTVGTPGGILKGFPRLEELLKVPEKLVDKATLAEVTGIVESILPNPVGGHDITIAGRRHFISPGLPVIVTIGQKITRGDVLSGGSIKPQELSDLKSHLDAQKYIVDQINDIYENKYHKKTFESVLRGVSNNAEITDIPINSNTTYKRGDSLPLSKIKKINKDLANQGKPLIQYNPYFKSITVLPTDSEDWLSRLTTNRLKQTIQEAAATGMISNIHSVDPIPSYLYGAEFNRNLDIKDNKFY